MIASGSTSSLVDSIVGIQKGGNYNELGFAKIRIVS